MDHLTRKYAEEDARYLRTARFGKEQRRQNRLAVAEKHRRRSVWSRHMQAFETTVKRLVRPVGGQVSDYLPYERFKHESSVVSVLPAPQPKRRGLRVG